MFESDEEKQSKWVLQEVIPPRIKQIFASAVYCGLQQAKKLWMENPQLPKNSRFDAGNQLRFIISYILTEIADNELTARMSYTETTGNSSPIFYWDSRVKLQIKMNRKPDCLPKISSNRASNAQINEPTLFNPDDFTECYVLITYYHKNFECSYIQIGIPDAEYKYWLCRDGIKDCIDRAIVENIEKNYCTTLQDDLKEEITKQYKLTLNQ